MNSKFSAVKSFVDSNPILPHQLGIVVRTCHTKPNRVATRKERQGVERQSQPEGKGNAEAKGLHKKVVLSSFKEVGVANAFLYKLKRIVLWAVSSVW